MKKAPIHESCSNSKIARSYKKKVVSFVANRYPLPTKIARSYQKKLIDWKQYQERSWLNTKLQVL
jgi:hypothetical protein